MAISVVFTMPPTPPSSTDKTNFRTRYDAFLAYIQNLGTLLISFITQLNSTETNINAKEASAVAAQVAAASSANFQGPWTNQTTVIGQSWLYGGVTYRVLIAGNTSPIASPANWSPMASAMGSIAGTFTTVANTWYRIATSALGQAPVDARFNISWTVSGQHGSVRFTASSMYGTSPCLSQISYSKFGANGITSARIVYHATAAGNYAYLEVMFAGAITNVAVTVEAFDITGWSLLPPSTAGSIPVGYTSLTYAFKATITPGTYPVVTVDSDGSVTSGSTALPSTTTATTPTVGDNSTKVATTAFVKAESEMDSIGVNQTWQDVTVSRALGVAYTNSTGKPIELLITTKHGTSATTWYLYMSSSNFATGYMDGYRNTNISVIVPNGSAYSFSHAGGTLVQWSELR